MWQPTKCILKNVPLLSLAGTLPTDEISIQIGKFIRRYIVVSAKKKDETG